MFPFYFVVNLLDCRLVPSDMLLERTENMNARRFGTPLATLAVLSLLVAPLQGLDKTRTGPKADNTAAEGQRASEKDDIVHGTINVVLANGHGIVALTDSMATETSASGKEMRLPEPMQKLFVLDDQTVCTIAGFVSQSAEPFAGATTDIATIIRDFQNQLRTKPIASFEQKFRALAMLVQFHLSLLATSTSVREGSNSPPARVYSFELIMAGYDSKGPRIGQFTLSATRKTSASGVGYYDVDFTSGVIETVGAELEARIGGQRYTALSMLTSMVPAHEPAAARYQESKAADGGASLSLDDLKALAIVLAAKTAARSPSVGGENQIAIIRPGAPIQLFQRKFDDTPRNVEHVSLMVSVSFQGCGRCIGGTTPILFIGGYFKRVEWDLDHDYFIGNKFVVCRLNYGGGQLSGFDKTNKIVDSELVLLPGWSVSPGVVDDLLHRYRWARIFYDSSATHGPVPTPQATQENRASKQP